MKSVIMDGTKGKNTIGEVVEELAQQIKEEIHYFKLEDLDIKPCRNCGGCSYKTPGQCVFKDDMPQILEVIKKARVCIWVTPITLGGYNSITKKVIDKLQLIGIPTMIVYKGRLQHPNSLSGADEGSFISIGIEGETTTEKEKEDFKFLIKENGLITCSIGYPFLVKGTEDRQEMKETLEKALSIGGNQK